MTLAIILFVASWCVIAYAMLRTAGEADELSDQFRKHLRDHRADGDWPFVPDEARGNYVKHNGSVTNERA